MMELRGIEKSYPGELVIVTHSPGVEARCRRSTRMESGLLRETAR